MVLERGKLFEPHLVSDLMSKVQGKSSVAKLARQTPIPFNGQKEFIFTMDSEIDVVAESGKKTHGGIGLEPVTINPIKIEYGARVSDEFMYASSEEQINILRAFNDGFSKKLARGLDLMAFHGVNPRSGKASNVIGDNHFDAKVSQTVQLPANATDANAAVEAAIAQVVGAAGEVTGMALSPEFRALLAKQKDGQGLAMFPDLAWGNAPGLINGLQADLEEAKQKIKELEGVIRHLEGEKC